MLQTLIDAFDSLDDDTQTSLTELIFNLSIKQSIERTNKELEEKRNKFKLITS